MHNSEGGACSVPREPSAGRPPAPPGPGRVDASRGIHLLADDDDTGAALQRASRRPVGSLDSATQLRDADASDACESTHRNK